jgi:putative transposase
LLRKSQFSDNQMISLLKEVAKGRAVKDVCRPSVSEATYNQGKSKYGGREPSEVRRLRDLESKNRRLKQI